MQSPASLRVVFVTIFKQRISSSELPYGTHPCQEQTIVTTWVVRKVHARPHQCHARDDELLACAYAQRAGAAPPRDVARKEHLEPADLRGPGGREARHGLRRLGRALRALVARAAAAAVGHGLVAVAHAVAARDGAAAVLTRRGVLPPGRQGGARRRRPRLADARGAVGWRGRGLRRGLHRYYNRAECSHSQ